MISPQRLAVRYEQYAAVLNHHNGTRQWRCELAAVRVFRAWIESFWHDDAPPEPADHPDAVSFGDRAAIVRWYDADSAILGYPTDLSGCYRVPAIDAVPASEAHPSAADLLGPSSPARPSPHLPEKSKTRNADDHAALGGVDWIDGGHTDWWFGFGGAASDRAATTDRVVAEARRLYRGVATDDVLEWTARHAVAEIWPDSIKVTGFVTVLALRQVRETLAAEIERDGLARPVDVSIVSAA